MPLNEEVGNVEQSRIHYVNDTIDKGWHIITLYMGIHNSHHFVCMSLIFLRICIVMREREREREREICTNGYREF